VLQTASDVISETESSRDLLIVNGTVTETITHGAGASLITPTSFLMSSDLVTGPKSAHRDEGPSKATQAANRPPKSGSKENILGVAIGISLGGAFLSTVVLFVIIHVIKRRRRAQFYSQSSPRIMAQAAKVAMIDENVSRLSDRTKTIRPVEAGTTPRHSWLRYSTLPEVVHEMGCGEDDDNDDSRLAEVSLTNVWKSKRRPLSSYF